MKLTREMVDQARSMVACRTPIPAKTQSLLVQMAEAAFAWEGCEKEPAHHGAAANEWRHVAREILHGRGPA